VQPVRTRRNRWKPALSAPLLAATALAILAQPAPALALSGGGNGADTTCTAGPASVSTEFTNPKRISGGGQLQCPAPGNNSPGGFGPHGLNPVNVPPPVENTPCHIVYQSPVDFRYPGYGPQYDSTSPYNLIEPFATTNFTADPWHGANFGVSTVNNPFPSNYISGDQWYYSAGFGDYYMTWWYDGTWKRQPDGTLKCAGQGWQNRCSGQGLTVQCFDFVPRGVAAPGPLPLTALGFDLNAFLAHRVYGGKITALPDNPNPGLTNIGTCFYVSGMTADRQPTDPRQDVYWEQIVPGPPVDDRGHQVYFVFVIHVFYSRTVWNFGDGGDDVAIPVNGTSPDPIPRECGPVPNQQFLVSHVYHKYSPPAGFQVTVMHHYGVDVTEVWTDTNGQTNRQEFAPAIPDLQIPGDPPGGFFKQVIQEEGVPVGG
jgi:hypothetical protein